MCFTFDAVTDPKFLRCIVLIPWLMFVVYPGVDIRVERTVYLIDERLMVSGLVAD